MNTVHRRNPVLIRSPNPAARLRLFCCPYAGGGTATYRDWSTWLPADIEVAAVQLPGREWRMQDALLDNMQALAVDVVDSLQPMLDKPFALLGTSMGGLLIFEVARRLRTLGLPAPRCLMPLACGAPHTPESKLFHHLPDAELLAEIRDFGVMADETAENEELLELVLPILRADCVAHETYHYSEAPPFDFPIWVYGGMGDETMERARLDAWAIHTCAESRVHMINGGHLFVDERSDLLLQSLARHFYQALS